jgi:hypothetical protein
MAAPSSPTRHMCSIKRPTWAAASWYPGCVVRAPLVVTLCWVWVAVGIGPLTERPADGSTREETASRAGCASSILVVVKLQRVHARPIAANAGPFTLPTLPVLGGPEITSLIAELPTKDMAAWRASRAQGARGPPAPPLVV